MEITPRSWLAWLVGLLIVTFFIFLLNLGELFLKPLFVAGFLILVAEAIASILHDPPLFMGRIKMRVGLARLVSVLLILVGIWIIGIIIVDNIASLRIQQSIYQENLNSMVGQLNGFLHRMEIPDLGYIQEQIRNTLNLATIFSALLMVFGDFASNLFSILLFLTFLLLEATNFRHKLSKIAGHEEGKRQLNSSLAHISNLIRRYIFTKLATSLLAGVLCYFVMIGFDLHFAAFWGLLIFVLNFIPYIGAIIAVVFPIVFALIEFQSWLTAGILLGILSLVLLLVGNFLEPKLMGKSLNLSPLMILLGLALFGSIWGFTGMFLSVPLQVLTMVICAQFDATLPLAILISDDGDIEGLRG